MSSRVFAAAVLAAVLLAPAASPAQVQSDEEAIKALIQTAYVDGLQNLVDLEKTKAGFHPGTDYLSLYRFPDGWKIVGKIYHRH